MDQHLVETVHEALIGDGSTTIDVTRHRIEAVVRAHQPLLDLAAVHAVTEAVAARCDGLGVLEPLLGDPTITEIMVNGPGPVWVERAGRLEPVAGVTVAETDLGQLVERIVAPLGLRVDRASPLVDARLPDGSRVNVVVPPLALDGPVVTIRRFAARTFPLAQLCPPAVAALLAGAVAHRANIVVSGGTGAGKTTFLNALASHIGPQERVVTVEDTAELRLPLPHVVRLEARPPNADGFGATSIRTLVRNALRMRPDRIVVGEVRAGEALDMLQAMNTGHEGSLSTCHANTPADALRRLETMVLLAEVGLSLNAVREQLAASIDLVVQLGRLASGERRITAVAEVLPELVDGSLAVRTVATAGGIVAPLQRPARWQPIDPASFHDRASRGSAVVAAVPTATGSAEVIP